MKRLRPRLIIIVGAAVGLIAGAAVYGAVTSASVASTAPVSFKPPQVRVALAPPPAAPCAAGQTLEKGVCIVHVKKVVTVKRVVVIPAPVIQAAAPSQRQFQPVRATYRYRYPYRTVPRSAAAPPAAARRAAEPEHEGGGGGGGGGGD